MHIVVLEDDVGVHTVLEGGGGGGVTTKVGARRRNGARGQGYCLCNKVMQV